MLSQIPQDRLKPLRILHGLIRSLHNFDSVIDEVEQPIWYSCPFPTYGTPRTVTFKGDSSSTVRCEDTGRKDRAAVVTYGGYVGHKELARLCIFAEEEPVQPRAAL